ncbi:hypothetical protein [Sphingomonas bacterium]|uniref:hypothetical protein n=1 Tax=Sphingomonas bacterium TaxID=1895847 RepID=UPI00261C174F|nr:hypothetical protein [Sphingomonas bacterium]
MNLLLLLSALLSALTGAGVGARAAPVAVAVSRSVETAVAAQAKPARAAGMVQIPTPSLMHSAPLPSVVTWRLPPAAPLYQSRRRE